MRGYIDNLTKLHNMLYLHENYHEFIKKNNYSIVISIDFQKLKYINDNFGHEVGDKSIIVFSDIIREVFEDSLLIRRSGDEFIIVTSEKKEIIVDKLYKVNNQIIKAQKQGVIPIAFTFNSGIKDADLDLKETLYKADITMYHAKRQNKLISFYQEELLTDVQTKEKFISKIDNLIENKKFNYQYQPIYDLAGNKTRLNQLYIRDDNNESIFEGGKFEILKTNYRIKRIDLVSLEVLFSEIIPCHENDEKFIINIHYQSLLSRENNFIDFITELVQKNNIDLKKIILSINVNEYNGEVISLIQILIELKKIGFGICINNVSFNNNECLLSLITVVDINYVNIDHDSIIKAMNERKFNIVLEKLIDMLFSLDIIPVFTNVEDDNDINFLKKFNNKCLVRGFLLSDNINIKKC